MQRILLVNGANLGLLGKRQPELYGTVSLDDVVSKVTKLAAASAFEIHSFQSNSEGALLDFLNAQFLLVNDNKATVSGIVINPGAFTHTSVALRDAVDMFKSYGVLVFEVHISNIFAREEFRHKSFLSDIATGVLTGFGVAGYEYAVSQIMALTCPNSKCGTPNL